jgi:hypothetical protein
MGSTWHTDKLPDSPFGACLQTSEGGNQCTTGQPYFFESRHIYFDFAQILIHQVGQLYAGDDFGLQLYVKNSVKKTFDKLLLCHYATSLM